MDTSTIRRPGGPVINMEGKLIGLENGNAGRSAVIPSNQIRQVIVRLEKDAEKAKSAK